MTIETSTSRPRAAVMTSLEDRYRLESGRVQLTGIQALARLPIEQHRRDVRRGLDVSTFVSGYEGSPLAGLDLELGRIGELLRENQVVFRPGLNEEAAATAVQGTQLLAGQDGAVHDGVVGLWYGKAPGLDRASDAIRHGNLMGADPRGGVVLLVGDDPGAKSSSVPCSSEMALADLYVPTLYPSDSQDILRLGQHAIELSRASGTWTALKVVTGVADGSATVVLDDAFDEPELPHRSGLHQPTSQLLQPELGRVERDLVTTRLGIVREYARLNALNTIHGRSDGDRIGIVAAGRTWRDTMVGLETLGLDSRSLADSPIRVLQLGMVWPLEPTIVLEFADGLDEIIVVEEKRSFVESALREVLYGADAAPRVSGKTDPDGRELIPAYGEVDVDLVVSRLGRALRDLGLVEAAALERAVVPTGPITAGGRTQLSLAARAPYFCSGCPHNSSTASPSNADGSGPLIGGGIGCHAMVLLMDDDQVGRVTGLSQMGGEGLQWIGMSPFIEPQHYVQNLGDGTFDHSGSLAVRAAVAAGVDITYKLLFNSAVAMTGGQQAVGRMDVRQVVDVLRSEHVARIIVTTEDLRRYRKIKLPRDVAVWDRSRVEEAMSVLAATPGVTVLIHDQECATEKRRRRRRSASRAPETRVVINERVCEGCGDCGRTSNCLSVFPVPTPLGRKTQIDQSTCNLDYSCVDGDCPAFMTVEVPPGPVRVEQTEALGADAVPEPARAEVQAASIRIAGIGGTGVVTVSQVLATAGLLAGWDARSLEQTGLAQKGGAVVSDVLVRRGDQVASNKIAAGSCDLYLGADILVAAAETNLRAAAPDRTRAVLSTSLVPTGQMVSDPQTPMHDPVAIADSLESVFLDRPVRFDARHLSGLLFGDDQFANMMVLGAGFQTGSIPLPAAAIEEAIRLNAVAVERNLQAFRRGRQVVSDPEGLALVAQAKAVPTGVVDSVEWRHADLIAYQDRAYADRYRDVVETVAESERQVVGEPAELTRAVAAGLYKLMAYKDEYEVARLSVDSGWKSRVVDEFGASARASWRLHPPALRALGMKRKIALGPAFGPALSGLVHLRRLRGTVLDPFGYATVRRAERALITEYVKLVDALRAGLSLDNHELAVQIAALPDMIRGYEQIKLDNIDRYRAEVDRLMQRFQGTVPVEGRRTHDG